MRLIIGLTFLFYFRLEFRVGGNGVLSIIVRATPSPFVYEAAVESFLEASIGSAVALMISRKCSHDYPFFSSSIFARRREAAAAAGAAGGGGGGGISQK